MKKFIFEIQSCIKVEVEGEDVDNARMFLIDNSDFYLDQILNDVYISEGEELNDINSKEDSK